MKNHGEFTGWSQKISTWNINDFDLIFEFCYINCESYFNLLQNLIFLLYKAVDSNLIRFVLFIFII